MQVQKTKYFFQCEQKISNNKINLYSILIYQINSDYFYLQNQNLDLHQIQIKSTQKLLHKTMNE